MPTTSSQPGADKGKQSITMQAVMRIFVVLIMIRSIFNGNYENTFVCALTLAMFSAPAFLEKNFQLDIPPLFQSIIYLFIFAAEVLGELGHFYVRHPGWDTMLHTINGFLAAAVGFSMIYLLNRDKKHDVRLTPLYLALVAFCFSMTIGVLWEFIEFSGDQFFGQDMQKDFIVRNFQSVTLDPEQDQAVIAVHDITKTVITTASGEEFVIDGGYLDIGIDDTMKDLFVNLIGAVVCSTIGYLSAKKEQTLERTGGQTGNDILSKLVVRPSARE